VSGPPVSVIVPVYRGVHDVRNCIESVIRHAASCDVPFELLVIDDATPEPEVRAYLDEVVTREVPFQLTVLHNETNCGFVRTMNRGLVRTNGDVVMLNADTVVTPRWLDRLARAAGLPDVATVTPLTNHGSICTLPQTVIDAFGLEGDAPRIDECAEFIASHSLELHPTVITGVGFCMYTTHAAIDRVGLLDEDTFGIGYGEEVDFCLRASRVGLRHIVDDSTFVYHRGGGSFGEEQQAEGWARGATILYARYPFFRSANSRERARDPLQVPFAGLELGLDDRDPSRPHVLQVLHSPLTEQGGTAKFVRALMSALEREFDFSVVYPVESGLALRTRWHRGDGQAPTEHEFLLPGAANQVTRVHDAVVANAFEMALDLFDVDAVHVHNLIGHSLAPLEVLDRFPGPVVSSVHDLFLACPNFSLLYRKQSACGIPEDLSVCRRCLEDIAIEPMPGSPMISDLSLEYLAEFRAMTRRHLDAVDHWVFASRSAADYFARVYELEPGRVELIEHGSLISLGRRGDGPDEALIFGEPLRVAFVGLGWAKKGLEAVNYLADALGDSSIEIHHFGDLRQPGSTLVHAHGPYENEYLPELLHSAGIHIVLLPGPYAETFGIVMSEALAAGLPVIGAGYGALGERIRLHGVGWTIDPLDHESLRQLIERLDRCRDELLRATERVFEVKMQTVEDTADRYGALYRSASR
jgi:GT2 family glycosyltransferase/glycosyltransferase involved in cell wall biosynthesis